MFFRRHALITLLVCWSRLEIFRVCEIFWVEGEVFVFTQKWDFIIESNGTGFFVWFDF